MRTHSDIPVEKVQVISPKVSYRTKTCASRGGIDDINPEDIIYGEYTNDNGEFIDLIYLDGDILRTFSGDVSSHPVMDELKILLRDDKQFYVVLINEVKAGFAFKRNDIQNIKVTSVVSSGPPSCVWVLRFENGNDRTLETDYQSYFAYGNTIRPRSITNADILDRVLPKHGRK